jgi:cytoskeleton protein RodZ
MKRFSRAEAAPSGDAARVGEELRDARESSGLSIEDMSAALRIRRVYLIALEEGRMRDLPSPAYAWGFVRNYANALGLDADEMVRRFRESAGQAVPKRQDLIFPEPVPERGVPAGIIVLVGVVMAVAAYVGWSNWSSPPNRTVDAIPAVPPRLERAAREGTAPEPPPLAVPGLSGGGSAIPGSTVTMPTPVQVPVVVPPPPPPPVVLSPTDVSRITLRFKAESWMQVRALNQTPLVARVFRSGETFTPPNQPALLVNLSIASAVELLIDGQVTTGFVNTTAGRQTVQLDNVMQRHTQAARPITATPPAPAAPQPRPATATPAPPTAPAAASPSPARPGAPSAAPAPAPAPTR